jgi:hypothetical protein
VEVLGYYARLGWREFGGKLLVRQCGSATEFTVNPMIFSEIVLASHGKSG